NSGAAGSYGTITEPCNYPQKFPDSQVFFYQARGFSLAECYYQGVTNPYQGMVAGEPLAAPFALPASGVWNGLASNAVLNATTNLSVQFTAPDALHPVQQIDLFVDGLWRQTLTNIAPHQGNALNVTLNGNSTSYTVPASATIKSVASGLAGVLNGTAYANATKVTAIVHGDRIELQSTDPAKTGAQVTLSVSNSLAGPPLTSFIAASQTNFLDSVAWGIRTCDITGTPLIGSFLKLAVTKTNGVLITLAVTNTVNGTTLPQLAQQLLNLVNTSSSPNLQGVDGLACEDLISDPTTGETQFNLRARGQGYAAAQIQANLSGSLGLVITPVGAGKLTDNLPDLEPRNHLYITAGATNLALTFPFNTALLPDGYHELTAVAYEGSHVRTQARTTQNVRIQNSALSATFAVLVGGTNTALEATLQFAVVANTNNIAKIELFSTGGLLGAVNNQVSAAFAVAGTNLDLGLHPFYALVTAGNGQQYRTETRWIRLVGVESPFALQIGAPPLTLVWAAAAGRRYDILSTSDQNNTFQVRGTITPTNSLAQWVETNANPRQVFYRIRVSP
ncbi:MAG: hypothetical protein JWR69_1217, partial [Pedosphaera sp.]|nr:hypothetical protein [Pedosphaera sp.]